MPVDAVRRFNRFYTRQLGVLQDHLLDSPFGLPAARVLFELAQGPGHGARWLAEQLGMDAGHLSRVLSGLERDGLLERKASPKDRRAQLIGLTVKGHTAFEHLNRSATAQIKAWLDPLAPIQRKQLTDAMDTVERLIGNRARESGSCQLRAPLPGDMGWVIQMHGQLYAQDFGWTQDFEALVARIVADYVRHFKPGRENCWVAEFDEEPVGCVFLVEKSRSVAQLRLLLVAPHARGLKLGNRLVDECIGFARSAGYRKMTLWTNDCLHAARHIYQRAGFVLVKEEPHHSFGHDLIGQHWDLTL
jgi:DNA-binding MarR family transcriptional regulator/GNAT superfamily N-acetyltransferase